MTLSLAFVASIALYSPVAVSETLLVERVQIEQNLALPARGSSMAQVQSRYGAPLQKYPPVSGPNDRRHNPPITRWAYSNFHVYFEHNHVINAVVTRINPQEIGPAPVQN